MHYVLVLGRDMNPEGTDVGPQVTQLLKKALEIYSANPDTTTLVAAPGFDSNFPHQANSYAEMMVQWLKKRGCKNVVQLCASTFDTDGELRAFRQWCLKMLPPGDTIGVCGFGWHLRRAFTIAYVIDVTNLFRWARTLKAYPITEPMTAFDRKVELLKWVKVFIPKRAHGLAVGAYKRIFGKRTSY